MSFERRPFADRLADAVRRCGNPVVVGLDPRWEQLPNVLNRGLDSPAERAAAFRTFCCEILDVVAHRVPAVKPQLAFFEELGPHGTNALADVIQHARRLGVLVILDGKRNDIGSTAEGYARAYLGELSAWQGDSLTVSPYLGDDSLTPFVKQAKDGLAGIFVLVKTSNPGGRTFQDLIADGKPLYRHVAELVESLAKDTVSSSGYGVAGAVVGATYPEQLAELRETMSHAWFLVPGFGAQGGSATDVKHAFHENGLGAIINSSRGIIFAHELPKYASWAQTSWQTAVDQATTDMVEQLRADTPVGTLPLA